MNRQARDIQPGLSRSGCGPVVVSEVGQAGCKSLGTWLARAFTEKDSPASGLSEAGTPEARCDPSVAAEVRPSLWV